MCSVCSVVLWFTYLVVNTFIANLKGGRIQAIMKSRSIKRFT